MASQFRASSSFGRESDTADIPGFATVLERLGDILAEDGGLCVTGQAGDSMSAYAALLKVPANVVVINLSLPSDLELEVFRFTGTGLEPEPIARKLHVSVKTVQTH